MMRIKRRTLEVSCNRKRDEASRSEYIELFQGARIGAYGTGCDALCLEAL